METFCSIMNVWEKKILLTLKLFKIWIYTTIKTFLGSYFQNRSSLPHVDLFAMKKFFSRINLFTNLHLSDSFGALFDPTWSFYLSLLYVASHII